MSFSFSYVYEAVDKFSPTAKKIKATVKDLNKELERTAVLTKATEKYTAKAAKAFGQLDSTVSASNKPLVRARAHMKGLGKDVDKTTDQIRQLQQVAKKKITVAGGVNMPVTGGGLAPPIAGAPAAGGRGRGRAAALAAGTMGGLRNSTMQALVGAVGIGKSLSVFTTYEKNLQSIAKVVEPTAKELDFLKNRATDLGREFGTSSNRILDSFKTVAAFTGDLPMEDLDRITTAAVTLSKAGEISVEQSASAISAALGQFNRDAKSAPEFMNIMASASAKGSSEIQNTAEALAIAGSVASNTGLSFAETNAGLQMLAKKNIIGRRAGTGFAGVLTNLLGNSIDGVNIKTHGLIATLEALKKYQSDTAGMAELFGKEHLKSGLALLDNVDALKLMIPAIQGTNDAVEQAARSQKGLNHAWGVFTSVLESKVIKTIERAEPQLKKLTNDMTNLLDELSTEDFQGVADGISIMATGAVKLVVTLGKAFGLLKDIAQISGETMAKMTTSARDFDDPEVQRRMQVGRDIKEDINSMSFMDKLLFPFYSKEKQGEKSLKIEVQATNGSTAKVEKTGEGMTLDTGTNVIGE